VFVNPFVPKKGAKKCKNLVSVTVDDEGREIA